MSDEAKCKSCKKSGDEITYLFALSRKCFICDECVEMCRDIIGARRFTAPPEPTFKPKLMP